MKVSPDLLVKVGAAAAILAGAWWLSGRVRAAAAQAGQAINPVNRENMFYRAANAVGGAIATDPDAPGMNADGSWSLGGWFYDITH